MATATSSSAPILFHTAPTNATSPQSTLPLKNQPAIQETPSSSKREDNKLHSFGSHDFLHIMSRAKKLTGDRELAKNFGNDVLVFSSPSANVYKSDKLDALPEPGGDAMALAYKFGGAATVSLISSHKSPHLLEYHPRSIVNIEHSYVLTVDMKADSAFFLNTSREELQNNAGKIPKNASVIISNNSMESVAGQVALLNHMRPDLKVYGHASALDDPKNNKGAIEAFRRVGTILGGKTAAIVRPLNKADSRWIKKMTEVDIPTGAAIPALFDSAGKLGRKAFLEHYKFRSLDTKQNLEEFIDIYNALNLSDVPLSEAPNGHAGVNGMRSAQKIHDRLVEPFSNNQDQLKKLGKVLLLGSTGNVGDGILRALSGRVEIDAPVRDPSRTAAKDHLGNGKHPVRQFSLASYTKEDFAADTAFIAAAVPREKGTTDRAGQLKPNLMQVMIPLMAKIPANVRLIQVITNPCADMAYAAWLLRPDLAGKISSHSGTDLVRQQNHVQHPNDPETYFTFGPHSPNQVNVDLDKNFVDASIATKASDINRRSGGQATTDPTSLSSIYEALNIIDVKQSSYALPLTTSEAEELQRFLRESGNEALKHIEVHEGLAPTLPRKNGAINWGMLQRARDDVPGFLPKAVPAIDELVLGRNTVLDIIAHMVNEKRPDLAERVDHEWVLQNRARLLGILDGAPQTTASR